MVELPEKVKIERDDAYSAFMGYQVKEVKRIVPWNRIGNYLHQHSRAAKWTEAVLYSALCFTLYHVGMEIIGYNNYSSRCQIPQTENIQGADTPERFIRVGKETFYSRIDGKEISDLVK